MGKFKRISIVAVIVLIGVSLVGVGIVLSLDQAYFGSHSTIPSAPITHAPTFIGSYPFILGSGNVIQNGSAYSYVWINASALKRGDSFTALPALNVKLERNGINENNFTVKVVYFGSDYGSSPYWLNFSVVIPILNIWTNSSQIGFEGNFSRSSTLLSGFSGVQLFSQISNVVGENNEFEYFFYVGNSSTPVPLLTHASVH